MSFKRNGAPLKRFKQESSQGEIYSYYPEKGCRSQRKRWENRSGGLGKRGRGLDHRGGSGEGERAEMEASLGSQGQGLLAGGLE